MNLQENIDRINSIMDEGKDAFVSRASFDQEYEEEYPKWGKTMVKFLDMAMNAYDENDNVIILFNPPIITHFGNIRDYYTFR